MEFLLLFPLLITLILQAEGTFFNFFEVDLNLFFALFELFVWTVFSVSFLNKF